MLIVHNHQPRLIDIPGPLRASPGSTGGVVSDFTVKLKPGANAPEPEQWAAVAEYGVIKTLIKEKKLEVVSTRAQAFEQMPIDEAIPLVRETLDRDLLKRWAEGESRAKVRSAIEAQIKKVTVEKKES